MMASTNGGASSRGVSVATSVAAFAVPASAATTLTLTLAPMPSSVSTIKARLFARNALSITEPLRAACNTLPYRPPTVLRPAPRSRSQKHLERT